MLSVYEEKQPNWDCRSAVLLGETICSSGLFFRFFRFGTSGWRKLDDIPHMDITELWMIRLARSNHNEYWIFRNNTPTDIPTSIFRQIANANSHAYKYNSERLPNSVHSSLSSAKKAKLKRKQLVLKENEHGIAKNRERHHRHFIENTAICARAKTNVERQIFSN